MLTNAARVPGDVLILTKPLGTGIVTTAIKRGLAAPSLERKAIRSDDAAQHRRRRTSPSAGLREAAVDVTGFGLLGHLGAHLPRSHVGAEIRAAKVPAIDDAVFELIAADCIPGGSRDNLAYANRFTEWDGATMTDKAMERQARENAVDRCADQRRLAAVRPGETCAGCSEAPRRAAHALRGGNRAHRALAPAADTSLVHEASCSSAAFPRSKNSRRRWARPGCRAL